MPMSLPRGVPNSTPTFHQLCFIFLVPSNNVKVIVVMNKLGMNKDPIKTVDRLSSPEETILVWSGGSPV